MRTRRSPAEEAAAEAAAEAEAEAEADDGGGAGCAEPTLADAASPPACSSLSSRYRRSASTEAGLSSFHRESTAPRSASAAWNLAPADAAGAVESRTARTPSRHPGEARKARSAASAVERVVGFWLCACVF